MYNNQLYASGVFGVFTAHWTLRCETPLAIRNGIKVTYKMCDVRKSRGMQQSFHWRVPDKVKNQDNEVAALHYGYEVAGDTLKAYHFVPSSSVRGALRSWTINHLLQSSYRSHMAPPPKEDSAKTEAYLAAVHQALADTGSGYHTIASLFGQAFDTRQEGDSPSNAGRLQLETGRFSQTKALPIANNGQVEQGFAGPGNVARQMTVRNPLDRITHASKEGGLHHFLEFCQGETFEVQLTIRNPQVSDLGILSLWRRELNDGLLRLGALSSIGRGRVKIIQENYQLWLGPGAPQGDWLERFIPNASSDPSEALADLWSAYTLPADKLDQFQESIGG